jgi:hypothetical protein
MWAGDYQTPNPPFSEALVEQVETMLGVMLPPSYTDLMRQQNGGYIEERLVRVDIELPKQLERHVSDGYVSVGGIAGLNPVPDAYGSVTQSGYMAKEWDLPDGLVLLDGDGHTWIALDYRHVKQDPPVIFVVSGEEQHVPIARSFAELLNKMIPYEDVYDDEGNLRNVS